MRIFKGSPLFGRSGKLLDKMLEAIDLNREKVYIANIVPWRPPNNRRPTDEEIEICLPMIKKHIEIVNPKAILLLGSTATYALIKNNEGTTKIRGKWLDIEINKKSNTDTTYIPPSFLVKTASSKKVFLGRFKKFKEKSKNNKLKFDPQKLIAFVK